MNMAHGRTGLKAAVMALGLLAAGATAQADPIITYSTVGTISNSGVVTDGVAGTPSIGFNDINYSTSNPSSNQSFSAPSAFSLGDFSVAALQPGQTATYTNTPFTISLFVNQVNGAAPNPNQTPITITGTLNGTISGNDQSTVVAQFNPISTPTFLTGTFSNTLSVFDNPLSLVPSTTNDGMTTAQAYMTSTGGVNTVPEPTSVALFLTAIGGMGWTRLRKRKVA